MNKRINGLYIINKIKKSPYLKLLFFLFDFFLDTPLFNPNYYTLLFIFHILKRF